MIIYFNYFMFDKYTILESLVYSLYVLLLGVVLYSPPELHSTAASVLNLLSVL